MRGCDDAPPSRRGAATPLRDIPSEQAVPANTARKSGRQDLDAVLGHAAPDRLSLLAAAYLLLPALIFLVGWARPWPGLAAAAAGLLALALLPGWRRGSSPPGRRALLLLGLGLLWAGATGAHHLIYSTADWQIRDAVLQDLAAGPWPVAYHRDGADSLLRAPLGFYLPAGLVGRMAGFHAAQAALWAWTGLGLALALALLADLARTLAPDRPHAFAGMAGLFVLFGGLDILPNMALDTAAGIGPFGSWGRGGEWWARLFQYAGHVTAILWAPNHALPAWLVALLLLRHGRHPAFRRGLAVPLAGAAFWSPVAALGAAALATAAVLSAGPRAIRDAALSPANLLAAAAALLPCLYLVAGSAAVPHGPLLSQHPPGQAAGTWALFLAIEVLAWAIPAALLVRGRLFGAATVILLLLPGYVFGPGNEMTSRGGMAPLAVLAVAAAAALLAPAAGWARRAARAALLACAALAAAGSLMEASLLVTHRPWPASAHCALPEAGLESVFGDSTDWSHYRLPWPDPAPIPWLRPPVPRPAPPPGPPCWPAGGP